MTIAICLKVGDGVVLGTDSASSLIGENDRYLNIYYSAEKTINLVKGWPVGMMTYGLGGLAGMSIASHARDLRSRLSGCDPQRPDWALDPKAYTMEQVAERVKEFFYDELYRNEFGISSPFASASTPATRSGNRLRGLGDPDEGMPGGGYTPLGFIIAGFSGADQHPEVWTVEIGSDGLCNGPSLLVERSAQGVMTSRGQPEALDRLVFGWSVDAAQRLADADIPHPLVQRLLTSYVPLAHPAMPMQDAIDLVRYLAEVTVGFTRFKAGPPTVAPPIDIAAITRHQGFRWIARKHYFPPELNSHTSWETALGTGG